MKAELTTGGAEFIGSYSQKARDVLDLKRFHILRFITAYWEEKA